MEIWTLNIFIGDPKKIQLSYKLLVEMTEFTISLNLFLIFFWNFFYFYNLIVIIRVGRFQPISLCLFETPKTKSISWDSSTMCDWVFKSFIVIPGNNKYKNISDSCPPQILSLITQIESWYLFGNPGNLLFFCIFLSLCYIQITIPISCVCQL